MNSRSEISPVSLLQSPSKNLTNSQPVKITSHKILKKLETNCELELFVVKWNLLHFVEFDIIAKNAHDTVHGMLSFFLS